MKKWVVILSLVLLTTITYTSWSQELDLFVKTVPIYKVYNHKKGFVIVYEKQNMDLHRTFIPYNWFRVSEDETGKLRGEVLYGNSPEYPYMSIFWDGGEFSHVRLFLQKTRTDDSWSVLDNPNLYDNSFDIEVMPLEF